MKLRFPHPLTLLVGFIVLAAVMTYVLPAGQFDRRDDPATGRSPKPVRPKAPGR